MDLARVRERLLDFIDHELARADRAAAGEPCKDRLYFGFHAAVILEQLGNLPDQPRAGCLRAHLGDIAALADDAVQDFSVRSKENQIVFAAAAVDAYQHREPSCL